MKSNLETLQSQFDLTTFQLDLLRIFIPSIEREGSYTYYKASIEAKYKGLNTPKDIKVAIDNLISKGVIGKENKKIIHNGRYSTQTKITILV